MPKIESQEPALCSVVVQRNESASPKDEVDIRLQVGDAAAPAIAEVRQISDLAMLKRVKDSIKPAQTLDDVRRIYYPSPEA